MKIVSDADFLSAFLKIKKINLILKVFQTKQLFIPEEVFFEISQSPSLLKEFLNYHQIKIISSRISLEEIPYFLGRGEIAAISLARKEKALLLCNDKKAIKFAQCQKVKILDIFSFLLSGKKRKKISNEETKKILQDLKEKDYLELGKDREKILSN